MSRAARTSAFERLRAQARALEQENFQSLRLLAPALPPLRLYDLGLDLTRQRVTPDILSNLLSLAQACELRAARQALFAGAVVNKSEGRAATHTQLRAGPRAARPALELAEAVRRGEFRLPNGERVRDVIHVGIGGSDIGPRLVVEALRDSRRAESAPGGPWVHFLSTLDPWSQRTVMAACDPRRTLVILASKSFATEETLQIWTGLRNWLAGDPERCALAATSAPERARALGVPPENVFPFAETVGGRFSLWSDVGALPIALACGAENFRQLLSGATAADDHFLTADAPQNIPLLHALYGFWERAVLGRTAVACLVYTPRLRAYPEWRQQVGMESNGKRVDQDGAPLTLPGTALILPGVGTEVQHTFMQALHQGMTDVPVEFTAIADTAGSEGRARLLAHALAQADALWFGRRAEELTASGMAEADISHRVMPGLRPSMIWLLRRLDAFHLGLLLALQEHSVFCEGALHGLNSFDQWGVELGKHLAGPWRERIVAGSDQDDFPFGLLGRHEPAP